MIEQITLSNGIHYRKDDFVYVEQGENESLPYLICRIISFKNINDKTFFLANWFYRPNETYYRTNRKTEQNLLIASMHSDLCPVSSIRGLCNVVHSHYIENLESFKQCVDSFYYEQLHDRYTKKLYDVVPLDFVNLPKEYKQVLKNYQFILVAEGDSGKFTTDRYCKLCRKWTDPSTSVNCIKCSGCHHLTCVKLEKKNLTKGYAWQCSRCLRDYFKKNEEKFFCNGTVRKLDDEIDKLDGNGEKNMEEVNSNLADELAKRNEFETQAKPLFPYRYFGDCAIFTELYLLGDEKGFPKSASRIGIKYQAEVPDFTSVAGNLNNGALIEDDVFPDSASTTRSATPTSVKNLIKKDTKKKKTYLKQDSIIERGGKSETVFSSSSLTNFDLEKLDEYFENVYSFVSNTQFPPRNCDIFDKALEQLSTDNYEFDIALEKMKLMPLESLNIKKWTLDDVSDFESGVTKYGHDLEAIHKEMKRKTMKDLVPFFYTWKRTKRYEHVYSKYCKVHRPQKTFKKLITSENQVNSRKTLFETLDNLPIPRSNSQDDLEDSISDSDEEDDTFGKKVKKKRGRPEKKQKLEKKIKLKKTSEKPLSLNFECCNCWNEESLQWYNKPISLIDDQNDALFQNQVLCEECYVFWLKHASLKILSKAVREKVKKRKLEFSDNKKPKITKKPRNDNSENEEEFFDNDEDVEDIVSGDINTEVPSFVEKKTGCAVCNALFSVAENLLVECSQCLLKVHQKCYGIASSFLSDKGQFDCDKCVNEKNREVSIIYECVLCTRVFPDRHQALKRTIGSNWCHVQCAVFIPGVIFGDFENFNSVENLGCVPKENYSTCQICDIPNKGATIKCYEKNCSRYCHITCGQEKLWEFVILEKNVKKKNLMKNNIRNNIFGVGYCFEHRKNKPRQSVGTQSRLNYLDDVAKNQSNLLKEYVKAKSAVDNEENQFVNKICKGEKRSISWQLKNSCSCHIHEEDVKETPKNINSKGVYSTKVYTTALTALTKNPAQEDEKEDDESQDDYCCDRCEIDVSAFWWEIDDLELDSTFGGIVNKIIVCQKCFWENKNTI
ncbi:putative PHD type zinc finger protein with BAH domain-containing protein [Lobulomyces angularis]|nr:putative PHD type zinc finger protein with BAH domain-containing protein [Lobulomyces angularis]